MRNLKILVLAFLSLVFAAAAAQAMTVSPMQVEMISTGKRSHAQVSVVNNSDKPLPIEAVVHRLTVDEAGHPKTSKGGGEFLIMPPQAMIAPGATQNFRVQWLGDPALAKSQSFMLYMNQIPVKLPKSTAGVQVVMSMGVMVNVAPATGVPDMKVVATGVAKDKTGKRFPTVTVENTSNVHALLPQATINLASGNWANTLTPRMIGDRIGIGLVQPGQRRKFTLPVELPATVSSVQANLEMAK
ncbi:MAG: molecular chaperone [Hyphomicrobium sp.]|nr:molecular chaperone [Hyphomicrobium sp.]